MAKVWRLDGVCAYESDIYPSRNHSQVGPHGAVFVFQLPVWFWRGYMMGRSRIRKNMAGWTFDPLARLVDGGVGVQGGVHFCWR